MPNITISLDEDIVREGRKYARQRGTSLNGLIRSLLVKTVKKDSGAGSNEFLAWADRVKVNSKGKKWRREDLYDV